MNSTFDYISNCGSLIRNDFTDLSSNTVYIPNALQQYMFQAPAYILLAKRNLDHGPMVKSSLFSNAPSPITCTTDPTIASIQQCYSIEMLGNTFSNFNQFKTSVSSFTYVDETLGMQNWGFILHLKSFLGSILIQDNVFSSFLTAYSTCEILSSLNTQALNPSYDQIQLRHVISIINTPHSIFLLNNTFSNNSVLQGVVYIQSLPRQQPAVIKDNNFTLNAAFYGTSALKIRTYSSSGRSVAQVLPQTETDLQCGGFTIDSNTFDQNLGCFSLMTSTVQFDCYPNSQYSSDFTPDQGLSQTAFDVSQTGIENYQLNQDILKAIKPSIYWGDTSVDGNNYYQYFVIFRNNVYSNNEGSQSGILNIAGLHLVQLLNETIENSSDTSARSLLSKGFSSMVSLPVTLSLNTIASSSLKVN